jgi:hypothetical protein
MTTEEWFERFDDDMAGLDEQRRKDWEEDCQLLRDTQRQLNVAAARINDLTPKMSDSDDASTRWEEESRAAREKARAADQELRERIAALVSGLGEWMARGKAPEHKPEN